MRSIASNGYAKDEKLAMTNLFMPNNETLARRQSLTIYTINLSGELNIVCKSDSALCKPIQHITRINH